MANGRTNGLAFKLAPTFPEVGGGRAEAVSTDVEGNGRAVAPEPPAPSPHLGRRWRILFAVGFVTGSVALFVGADVLEHRLFPEMRTNWRHALLTLRAAIVATTGVLVVFMVMKRQRDRIDTAAEILARRLEAFRSNGGTAARFLNRNRTYCRELMACQRTECPAYDTKTQPCWQLVALSKSPANGRPAVTVQQCHECRVYQASCPDGLTKLGESFNSLMFMLEEEAAQVQRIHAQMVEREKLVAVGQLAAGIAHEIGNPLSSISSIVQMLKRRPNADSTPAQLELTQKHIHRISATVRQLAGLAHPTTERWEQADPTATLEEAVNLVAFDQRARRVTIVRQWQESLPRTAVLRGQLQQVFINLMLNAFDAMERGGVLTIRTKAAARLIAFEFEDTGCGIAPDIQRRIFEPFFTTKEQGRGTGMGLAVSYGIVQKHGGTLEFSAREGGGTVFRVEIPVTEQAPDS